MVKYGKCKCKDFKKCFEAFGLKAVSGAVLMWPWRFVSTRCQSHYFDPWPRTLKVWQFQISQKAIKPVVTNFITDLSEVQEKKIYFKPYRLHDQHGPTPIYGKTLFWNQWWLWNLITNTEYSRPTIIVQMMTLNWPGPFHSKVKNGKMLGKRFHGKFWTWPEQWYT